MTTRPFKMTIRDKPSGMPYMIRYHLFRCRWFRVFVHHILLADGDRDPHNHPWSKCWAFVLRGGYTEERREMQPQTVHFGHLRLLRVWYENVCSRFGWNSLGGGTYHRITAVLPGTWTLFIAGPRDREWGFLVRGEHVDWRTYLGLPADATLED